MLVEIRLFSRSGEVSAMRSRLLEQRKGSPCHKGTDSLAELCPSVSWKAGLGSLETAYLAEVNFKAHLRVQSGPSDCL